MKRKDVNQIAFDVMRRVTGESAAETRTPYQLAAAKYGRSGGLKGGHARKKSLTAKRRAEIASKAAKARWGKRAS